MSEQENRWTPIGELANLLQISFLKTVKILQAMGVLIKEDNDRFAMHDLIRKLSSGSVGVRGDLVGGMVKFMGREFMECDACR